MAMNRLLAAILAFLVAGNVSLKGSETSATKDGPEPADYVCQRAETLPNLDGRLEEPMWEAATWADLRHVVGNAAGEAVGGEAYKFRVDDPGWRAKNEPGCAILANAAAVFLAGTLDVRPAGNDKYDSTLVAIFKIDSTERQKLRRY